MVDKECQAEDVVIVSAHQFQTLSFDQQDMMRDEGKYYTGVANLPTVFLLLKCLLPEMKSVDWSLTHFNKTMAES